MRVDGKVEGGSSRVGRSQRKRPFEVEQRKAAERRINGRQRIEGRKREESMTECVEES